MKLGSTITVPVGRSKTASKRVLRHRSALILVSALAAGKAAILLLVYLLPAGWVMKSPTSNPSSSGLSSLMTVFANLWDAANYTKIAHLGYPVYDALMPSKLYAFSPVFPSLIYLGHFLTGSFLTSAFLITNVLSFVFPLMLLRLVNFRTALLVALFPTYLVFTTVAYSDALALVFLGLGFLCFFKGRYLLAGVAIGAAGLVLYDLFVAAVPFLVYMLLFQKERRLRAYAGVLVPVALAGASVLAAYEIATGNPFTFFQLERMLWGVKLSNPLAQLQWLSVHREAGTASSKFYVLLSLDLTPTYWVVRNLLFEAFLVGGIFLLTKIEDPRKWLYVTYSVVVALPLFFVIGTPVYSIPRLMLAAFPIFIGYSPLVRKRWQLTVYAVLAVLASFWMVLSFVYAFSA